MFKEEESLETVKMLGLINNLGKYQNIESYLKKIQIKSLDWKKQMKSEIF